MYSMLQVYTYMYEDICRHICRHVYILQFLSTGKFIGYTYVGIFTNFTYCPGHWILFYILLLHVATFDFISKLYIEKFIKQPTPLELSSSNLTVSIYLCCLLSTLHGLQGSAQQSSWVASSSNMLHVLSYLPTCLLSNAAWMLFISHSFTSSCIKS